MSAADDQPGAAREGAAAFVASLIATVTGNVYLLFGSILFSTLVLLVGWIPLPHGSCVFFPLVRWWSRLLLLSGGVRMTREVETPLDRDRPYVFLSNHQSLFDIPVLLATLPVPARFMAKRELFHIPLFGWGLRVGGFIPVARGSQSARDSFRAGISRLEHGQSVLLFPEETRSTDGRLLPFKRGGLLLAQKAAVPVVPVGINGTLHVRTRNSYRIHPGRVTVRYGTPLELGGGGRGEGAAQSVRLRHEIARLAGVDESDVANGDDAAPQSP